MTAPPLVPSDGLRETLPPPGKPKTKGSRTVADAPRSRNPFKTRRSVATGRAPAPSERSGDSLRSRNGPERGTDGPAGLPDLRARRRSPRGADFTVATGRDYRHPTGIGCVFPSGRWAGRGGRHGTPGTAPRRPPSSRRARAASPAPKALPAVRITAAKSPPPYGWECKGPKMVTPAENRHLCRSPPALWGAWGRHRRNRNPARYRPRPTGTVFRSSPSGPLRRDELPPLVHESPK